MGRAPCVGRSLLGSGALCVGALCVGRSLVGPSPPVSDPSHVDIRSRDGSRSSARSHGWYLWSHGEPGGRRAGPRPHTRPSTRCKFKRGQARLDARRPQPCQGDPSVGVYKILFYFEAHVHESIIFLLPPPTRIARTIARPLHDYCAIYHPPPTLLVYTIPHTTLVMAISCIGRPTALLGRGLQ